MEQHRGTLILVLGIIGIVACQILGPIAWIMGNSDLQKMAAGTMDPEGQGMTNAGKICGIVATVLLILGVIFAILWFVLFAGVVAAGASGALEMQPQ